MIDYIATDPEKLDLTGSLGVRVLMRGANATTAPASRTTSVTTPTPACGLLRLATTGRRPTPARPDITHERGRSRNYSQWHSPGARRPLTETAQRLRPRSRLGSCRAVQDPG